MDRSNLTVLTVPMKINICTSIDILIPGGSVTFVNILRIDLKRNSYGDSLKQFINSANCCSLNIWTIVCSENYVNQNFNCFKKTFNYNYRGFFAQEKIQKRN